MSEPIPDLGLGTYRNDDPEQCARSVRTALEVGYRHIDTAEAYGNEAAVGEGLRASSVDREDVFLATKVLHPKFTDDYSAEAIYEAGRACLDRLGVESVDLFYGIHWPDGNPPAYDPAAVAEACERLAAEGAFDRFGVCNLTPEMIDAMQAATDLTIDSLQVEMHPLLPQADLQAYCAQNDIDIVAYGPLGNGRVLEVPELQAIAEKHDASPAQVSLAWLRDQGVYPIPKATGRAHIRENWASRNLDLDDEDIERIDAIDPHERVYDPDYAPDW